MSAETDRITQRRKPWERRPGEPEGAYRIFRHYLQTQPVAARSILNSYREIYGRPEATGVPGFISTWSGRFEWRKRCRQFDNELARQETQAIIRAAAAKAARWAERREMIAEADFNDGEALRAKVREMLQAPTFRQTIMREEESPDGRTIVQHITIEPVNFTFAQASQMLRTASERQRLAADMATEIVETVTPDSQAASRLAEARVVLDEARERFPAIAFDALAQQIAATFNVPVDDLLETDGETGPVIEIEPHSGEGWAGPEADEPEELEETGGEPVIDLRLEAGEPEAGNPADEATWRDAPRGARPQTQDEGAPETDEQK